MGQLKRAGVCVALFALGVVGYGGLAAAQPAPRKQVAAISGNPAETDFSLSGTGWLGRTLGLRDEWGIKLGGMWLADLNNVLAGGNQPGAWTANHAVVLGLDVDAEKLVNWRGAKFGFQFLQMNVGDTNNQAGSVSGYNGLVPLEPFNRTEIMEAWYSQEMIKDVLKMRIGRSVPTDDFGNVTRPITYVDPNQNIASVSGLLYSPIFVNASMIGAALGFPNPGNGITINFAPTRSFYVNYGFYDGNRYRGIQTGVAPPQFNGYYLNIGEIGTNWTLGEGQHPGQFGIGLWRQTGSVTFHGSTEDGTGGFYGFGSQRVAYGVNAGVPTSSVSVFYQFGANASVTLPITQYYGAGLTAFGLIGSRALDSMGAGVAISRLNPAIFVQPTEVTLQAYYQAHLFAAAFLQPTLTYIPTPGSAPTSSGSLAATLRLTVLF